MPRRPPRPWYPPPSRPRPADGIKAKSRTGAIGATGWSRRFIATLEAFALGPRLARGKRYARAGQVPAVAGVPADALLGELGDPGLEIRGSALGDLLRPAYQAMTEAARRRISGAGATEAGR